MMKIRCVGSRFSALRLGLLKANEERLHLYNFSNNFNYYCYTTFTIGIVGWFHREFLMNVMSIVISSKILQGEIQKCKILFLPAGQREHDSGLTGSGQGQRLLLWRPGGEESASHDVSRCGGRLPVRLVSFPNRRSDSL